MAFNQLLNETYLSKQDVERFAQSYKSVNEKTELAGTHTAFSLTLEELYEFFSETDKARQVEEAIQNAALWVRIIEEITK